MKRMLHILAVVALCQSAAVALSPDDIAEHMSAFECYRGKALMEMSMPGQGVEVVYDVNLMSQAAAGDTMSPCDYLIEWRLAKPEGREHGGFSSYFDGRHYRYRGERLQTGEGGAASSQFVMLLPQFIAGRLDEALADGRVQVTESGAELTIDVEEAHGGEIAHRATYVVDGATLFPLRSRIVNNPDGVGEQIIDVEYSYDGDEAGSECPELTIEHLTMLYPEVFSVYNSDDFEISNLVGMRLPGFSLPTADGERYSRQMGDEMRTVTFIAFLDPMSHEALPAIGDVREAIAGAQYPIDVIWAFIAGNHDDIDRVMSESIPGEWRVMNADRLARDCGVMRLPAVLIVDAAGVVRDTKVGYNKGLSSILAQKLELLND